jgi:hypothetical protein
MVAHYSYLSERDRRHYAAIEAAKLGRDGTSYISKLLGISRTTIICATKQLETLASGEKMLVNNAIIRLIKSGIPLNTLILSGA